MKNLREEILKIATYHANEGTSGYLLTEKQVDSLINLFHAWALKRLEEKIESFWKQIEHRQMETQIKRHSWISFALPTAVDLQNFLNKEFIEEEK